MSRNNTRRSVMKKAAATVTGGVMFGSIGTASAAGKRDYRIRVTGDPDQTVHYEIFIPNLDCSVITERHYPPTDISTDTVDGVNGVRLSSDIPADARRYSEFWDVSNGREPEVLEKSPSYLVSVTDTY